MSVYGLGWKAFRVVVPLALSGPVIGLAEEPPPAGIDVIEIEPLRGDDGADAPKSSQPRASRLVEEIVVTAQKREERLQDVPISVMALTADTLDVRGVVTVRDIALLTPGLQFTDLAGYTLISLRGVGSDAFIPSADPSVATYVDGVYFPSAHSLSQAFGAIDRIEVLKGPQGTLFGRNSTGGAINVITRKPDMEPLTELQLSYARFDDFKGRVFSNIPLTETVAVSVSGVYNIADSYYRREHADGRELLDEVTRGARVKIGWYPSESVDLILSGIRLEQNGSGTAASVTTHPSALARLLGIPAEDREYVFTADSFPSIRINTRALYGEGTARLSPFDVKLMASYYDVVTDDFQYDFDASERPIVNFIGLPEYQTIKTAELQFTSNAESWLSDRLRWVGGIYYLESSGGYDPAILQLGQGLFDVDTDVFRQLIPQPLIDLLGPLPLPGRVALYFRGVLGTESYSAYLQGTYSFTDWLDLTAGARYQDEERALLVSNVEIDNLGGGSTTLIPYAPRSSRNQNVSPRVSLDLRVIPDTLTYVSYSGGFKSATYNIVNIYQQPDYVAPEEVTAFELGIKSTYFDGLRLNAAVFHTEIRNLQTAFVSLTAGGAVRFQNAGEARIQGVEFDAVWQPMPEWNPGLVVTPAASYLDARYTSFPDGSGFDETTGLYFGPGALTAMPGRDFSGNRIARTPRVTATLGVSQTLSTRAGPVELGADYYYNGGYYFLAQNSDVSHEPAYALLNARASFLYEPWALRLTLFGTNLTDERYNLQQFHTDFGRADTLAPPIGYGVRVDWTF